MLESQIQRRVLNYLATFRDSMAIKIIRTNTNGTPDVVFMWKGKCIWIELKRPGQKPRPLQQAVARRITRAGCSVYTATSIKDVKEIIRKEFGHA